jgi:predicted acyltransferase
MVEPRRGEGASNSSDCSAQWRNLSVVLAIWLVAYWMYKRIFVKV